MYDDAPQALSDNPRAISRRRIMVFCAAFLLACAVSLIYVYARPAQYRAVAVMQITPSGMVGESNDDTKAPDVRGDPKSFLTEVQVLASRPLLAEVARRLKNAGRLPGLGRDPVGAMQRMLHAAPVADTQVVQLSAIDSRQDFVAELVNAVTDAYRRQTAVAFKDYAASSNADVGDEARKLHAQVLAKQREVQAYRDRYDIVSLDRTENDVLAKIQGLNQSYTDNNATAAKAQGHLAALRSAMAAGHPITRLADSGTLGALETELNTLQEKKNKLDRVYNSAYLALDEDTKSLPGQIADLQKQLQDRRAESAQAAIVEAEGDLATAQAASGQLRGDMAQNQQAARSFASRLAAFKVLQDDLDHLTAMERAVNDRSAKMLASVRERAPHVRLVEAAAPSLTPWRPLYTRDALIAVSGSLLFALLATLLSEYLHGPAPARNLVVHHALAMPALGRLAGPAFQILGRPLMGAALPGTAGQASLPAPELPPRELGNAEIAALLVHASAQLRLIVMALLSGLDAGELVALKSDQINLAAAAIHVGGAAPRTLSLDGGLAELLGKRERGTGQVLRNASGEALTVEELDKLIVFGAYDAGLARPQEVTAALLRHTYLTFLLRQGLRAADIERIAGHVPQDELMAYFQRASPRARLPLEQIDPIHPALRG